MLDSRVEATSELAGGATPSRGSSVADDANQPEADPQEHERSCQAH